MEEHRSDAGCAQGKSRKPMPAAPQRAGGHEKRQARDYVDRLPRYDGTQCLAIERIHGSEPTPASSVASARATYCDYPCRGHRCQGPVSLRLP